MTLDNPNTSSDAKSMSEAGYQSHRERRYSAIDRLVDLVFASFVILMIIFFAPLSWTYFSDETRTSNWTDKVLSVLISHEFAYGTGSGSFADGQLAVLVRNISTMLPHTIVGSVAIIIGLAQFSKTLQFTYPIMHRALGRVYVACGAIICLTSASFLSDTVPSKEVFSGEPFALILSILSIGVFGSMVSALRAIWKGDVSSHREYMVQNYSLMLSAPLLRVFWVILGRVWNETKYVINLYSAVWTGPLLLLSSIFYLRRRYSRPPNPVLVDRRLRLAVVASGAFGVVFCSLKLPNLHEWSYPMATFWSVVPQWIFQFASFTLLAERAKRRGDMAAYVAWVTYQNGLISCPAWAIPAFYISRDLYGCPPKWIGLSTISMAWVTGLSAAFKSYVSATAATATTTTESAPALSAAPYTLKSSSPGHDEDSPALQCHRTTPNPAITDHLKTS